MKSLFENSLSSYTAKDSEFVLKFILYAENDEKVAEKCPLYNYYC